MLRLGFSPMVVRIAIEAQAPHEGLTADDGLDVALRVLNAPEADPSNAIVCAALPGDRFLGEEIGRPPSILGDGLLLAGDVGVLYGRPGLGKSWLLIQLAAAATCGKPFLGFPVAEVRVGIISLEGHDWYSQHRLEIALRQLHTEKDGRVPADKLSILTRRRLGRRLELLEDSPSIQGWIEQERLGLVLLDPLSKLHCRRETAEELGPVLEAAEEIAANTGAALLISHHERKPPGGRSGDDEDLHAIRGSTRLATDPRLLIRLRPVPRHADLRMLVFTKVSYAAPPLPVYLRSREGADGYLELAEMPMGERKADQRRERLRAALEKAGAAGLSRAQAQEITGLSPRGTIEALKAVGAVQGDARGPHARWYLPEYLPASK